jgi:hypothetical protein
MDNIIEHNGKVRFANGQNSRDLRVSSGTTEPDTRLDAEDPRVRTDSSDGLEALRKNSDEELERRIELTHGTKGESGTSGGGSWFRRITRRVVLVVLLVLALGALSPFAWNYLQSYESTDDAQIDGHIDP